MKTALVTGASRGIGAAIAATLARQGVAVALHYHKSEEKAKALASQLEEEGHTVLLVQGDVASATQVNAMVDQVVGAWGHLDILVCNAGVAHKGLLCDVTEEQWRGLMGTDLDGVFYCCRAAYRPMVSQKWGRIVTISSMWGQWGASYEVAYSAAKAGVIGLTKGLAQELGPSGITVNCVTPGVIDTQMNADLTPEDQAELANATPLGRLGTPQEVAQAVAFLCSDQAAFVTGQVLGVDGGFLP